MFEIPANYKRILSELNFHKRDKNEILQYYINKRLNDSLQTYYHELAAEMDSLAHRNELKVMRNVGKGVQK